MTSFRFPAIHFPLWMRRSHSWWFALQVAANLAAAAFFIRLVAEYEWGELGLGLLMGQAFLVGVWLSLGGLPNLARFLSVFATTLAGALLISGFVTLHESWAEWLDQSGQIFIICFCMVLLFHALLLPLRWLLGWRIDFDPAYHRQESGGRLQIGIMHILGWTTFLAIPCGLMRLLPPEEVAGIAVTCVIVAGMTLPVSASLTMLFVGRRPWRWSLISSAVFFLSWGIESLIPNDLFQKNLLHFNLGILAMVAGNLLILRLFGLRLFSVISAPEVPEKQPALPSLSAPHFRLTQTANASSATGS